MSWHFARSGRALSVAAIVAEQFEKTGGAWAGTAEEAVKNELGRIVATLCASLKDNPVVAIEASGSAWHQGDKALSQHVTLKLSTLGDFVE